MLDFATTVLFLSLGVQEANPFIRELLERAPSPFAALLIAKGLAVSLGLVAWQQGRSGLLRRANLFFAGVVAWNVLALSLQIANA